MTSQFWTDHASDMRDPEYRDAYETEAAAIATTDQYQWAATELRQRLHGLVGWPLQDAAIAEALAAAHENGLAEMCARMTDLHHDPGGGLCEECGQKYPCATVREANR